MIEAQKALVAFGLLACGGRTELDGTTLDGAGFGSAPQPRAPCSKLVLRAAPRVVMSSTSGSASGPKVVQRAGGFDLIGVFGGERTGARSALQVRRVDVTSPGTELKLGPLVTLASPLGSWVEAVATDRGVGFCYDRTVGVLQGDAEGLYLYDWSATLDEAARICTGIAARGDEIVTATRLDGGDGGYYSGIFTWNAGALLEQYTPWPLPEGLYADARVAVVGGTHVVAAALDYGERIELRFVRPGAGTSRTFTVAWSFGEMRQPDLGPWPFAPEAVAAAWRELEDDPIGTPRHPVQPFAQRLAAFGPDGLLFGPVTIDFSEALGAPASLGSVDGKLLLASVLQRDASSDALEVVLTLLDASGNVVDRFSAPTRAAVAAFSGAVVATLNRQVLLAWTASPPGDATYRWTEIHAALLECQ